MEIKLFHTNDIHSHLYNYLKIKNYLTHQKKRYRERMVYADLGDHVDRSHPYTEATLGKGNVDLLNQAGCDVATLGNNEGITLEINDLKSLYDDADFDVVCANLLEGGKKEPYFKPYVIKEINGIKFGFIGITVEFTPFYKALGWNVSDAFEWVERCADQLSGQVDCLVLMSHLGKYDDETLANRFPEIDVILGAHTHHHFENGDVVGPVLIGAAGRFGDYLGEITLTFEGKTLVDKSARLIDTDMLSHVDDPYYEHGRDLMRENIIKWNTAPVPRHLYHTSRFISRLAYMIRDFADADASIVHTGLIAKGFEGGTLSEYELHKVLPHPINVVKIKLSGRELKEIFNQAMRHEFRDDVVRGMGFRGDIFGTFVTDNIGYIQSKREYYIGEEPISEHRTYTLGTLDMYTFGRIFPQFKSAKKIYMMPEFLRDIVKLYNKDL
ncbi:MAG TPA: bifunctional metallophosphatase/5'-nucleotidase [Candidatus Salinicoccus merdavium]|nr:bifunctional metallophosphatase/5'-nucleotidase [Candidatus Salinicoccus merdavium]